jgi:hypothetical protein
VQLALTEEEKLELFDGAKSAEDKLINALLLTNGLRRVDLVNISLILLILKYIYVLGKGNWKIW